MKLNKVHLPVTHPNFGSVAGRCFRFFILLLLSLQFACSNPVGREGSRTKEKVAKDSFSLSTFRLESNEGFGYDILNNNHIIIHQEFIPALEGKQLFRSREEAMAIGNAVLKKIENKQSPSITKEEVLQLLGSGK